MMAACSSTEVWIFDDGTGIEPPVPLGLRLNGLVQGGEPLPGAVLDDEAMKVAIVVKDVSRFAFATRDLAELPVEGFQLGADLLAFAGREKRDAAAGDPFQVADDQVKLVGIILGQRGDNHSRLFYIAVLEDIALSLQPVNGATNGGATHVEALCQFGFQNSRSRRKFAMNDKFTDFTKCR